MIQIIQSKIGGDEMVSTLETINNDEKPFVSKVVVLKSCVKSGRGFDSHHLQVSFG